MCSQKVRVIIAEDEPITRMDLSEMLTNQGYDVVFEATDGYDAINACKRYQPDILITDVKMPHLDGLTAAKTIYEKNYSDTIVLLTAYNEREFIERAKEIGVGGYLVKPIDEKSLVPSIELAMARSLQLKKMKEEVALVNDRLESRNIIERAKCGLMERNKITEKQAYDKIREISKHKNISMKRVSEMIMIQLQKTQIDSEE